MLLLSSKGRNRHIYLDVNFYNNLILIFIILSKIMITKFNNVETIITKNHFISKATTIYMWLLNIGVEKKSTTKFLKIGWPMIITDYY